jgi:hypothetical protein
MGLQSRTGATGPRGHRGARGATGMTGRQGKSGKVGRKGPKGLNGVWGPLHKRAVLDAVVTNFDDVYQQLTGQMKLIANIQKQLAAMTATRADMPPGGTEKPCPKGVS